MTVLAEWVANGSTTVVDVNSQSVRLDKGQFVTFSDPQWAALPAAQKRNFRVDVSLNTPTIELAYAERLTQDTTTNATLSDAALIANKISGLAMTITGKGKPVKIEFATSGISHSVADKGAYAFLLINGSMVGGIYACVVSSFANKQSSANFSRRLVLTDGVDYLFEIGKWVDAAGTGTYAGATNNPMFLTATQL